MHTPATYASEVEVTPATVRVFVTVVVPIPTLDVVCTPDEPDSNTELMVTLLVILLPFLKLEVLPFYVVIPGLTNT